MQKFLRVVRNLALTAGVVTAAGIWYRKRAERLLSLRGQTVLITAVETPLGQLVAEAAAQRGAGHIVVWSGEEAVAQQLVARLEAAGATASYDVVDLASGAAVIAGAKAVQQRAGGADFIFHTATVTGATSLLDASDPELDEVFQRTVLVLYRLTEELLPNMLANNFGSITVFADESTAWAAYGFIQQLRTKLRGSGNRMHMLFVRSGHIADSVIVEKTLRAVEAGKQHLIQPRTTTFSGS